MLIHIIIILYNTADSLSQNPEELNSERRYKVWNCYYY